MDSNPGWLLDFGAGVSRWAWGTPTGGGGEYGNPDPTSGYTGSNVVGYSLSGDYRNNMNNTQWARTPAIDCSDYRNITLNFYRWLNVEEPSYDHAYIEVSSDKSSWNRIWENTQEITDSSWQLQMFNVSSVANGQPTVFVRWGMGPTDRGWRYSGWNIDDVRVTGVIPGDFQPDGYVDMYDFAILASAWRSIQGLPNWNQNCDISLPADDIIDVSDLKFLAENWLEGVQP